MIAIVGSRLQRLGGNRRDERARKGRGGCPERQQQGCQNAKESGFGAALADHFLSRAAPALAGAITAESRYAPREHQLNAISVSGR